MSVHVMCGECCGDGWDDDYLVCTHCDGLGTVELEEDNDEDDEVSA